MVFGQVSNFFRISNLPNLLKLLYYPHAFCGGRVGIFDPLKLPAIFTMVGWYVDPHILACLNCVVVSYFDEIKITALFDIFVRM